MYVGGNTNDVWNTIAIYDHIPMVKEQNESFQKENVLDWAVSAAIDKWQYSDNCIILIIEVVFR